MKMKRIIAVLLFSASLLSMAACSQNNSQGNSAPAAQSTVAKEAGTNLNDNDDNDTDKNDTKAEIEKTAIAATKIRENLGMETAVTEDAEIVRQLSAKYADQLTTVEQRATEILAQNPNLWDELGWNEIDWDRLDITAKGEDREAPDQEETKRLLMQAILIMPNAEQLPNENIAVQLNEYVRQPVGIPSEADILILLQAKIVTEEYPDLTANARAALADTLRSFINDYPEQYFSLNHEQLYKLLKLRGLTPRLWIYPAQEALIMGIIDGSEKKLTLDEVKELIAQLNDPTAVLDAMLQKQFPDNSGGSGMSLTTFTLEDGGSVSIVNCDTISYRPANATSEEDDVILWSPLQTNHPT